MFFRTQSPAPVTPRQKCLKIPHPCDLQRAPNRSHFITALLSRFSHYHSHLSPISGSNFLHFACCFCFVFRITRSSSHRFLPSIILRHCPCVFMHFSFYFLPLFSSPLRPGRTPQLPSPSFQSRFNHYFTSLSPFFSFPSLTIRPVPLNS